MTETVYKENCIARVSFSGGIIGLFVGDQKGCLQRVIATHNQDGWNLVEIITEDRNLLVWLVRLVLLVVTLFLWTVSTGYLLIFERPRKSQMAGEASVGRNAFRVDPPVTSIRRLEGDRR